MKLVTYSMGGGAPHVGYVEGDEIRPLGHEEHDGVHRARPEPRQPGEETVPLAEARLHAPIAGPGKIIAIGLNYEDHAAETGADIPEKPIVFAKYPNTVIGPGEAIRIPPITEQADYEAELGVVIGRAASNVSESEALDYVFGYTNANDVSSRDLQFSEGGQWTRSKSIDTFCPIGPYIATRDEMPDPQDLSIRCILNGEAMQDGTTAKMIFSGRRARLVPLHRHDAGARRRHHHRHAAGRRLRPRPPGLAKAGDEVTIEIEGLGALTNPVEAE